MELRQLRYFVAVAEELHFRRAAERLFVAQPAVSEQVRKLEAEVGAKLLERTPRSVSLTNAGAAMLYEARRVLQQAEVARTVARLARDQPTTRLRLGYAPAALIVSVVHALQRVAASAPHVEVILEARSPADLIRAIRDDRLDAAVVPLPVSVNGLRVASMGDQPVVAAVRAGHPHALRGTIDLSRLAPDRLLVLPRDASPPLYDAIAAVCHRAGVSPRLVELPADELERAVLAVASAAEIALLPGSLAERYVASGIRFLPLEGPEPVVATGVITACGRDHLPAAAFLRALRGAVGSRSAHNAFSDSSVAA